MSDRTPSRSISLHSDDHHSPLLEPSANFHSTVVAHQDTGASPKTVDESPPHYSTHTTGGVIRRTRERREGQERLIQILHEVGSLVGGFAEVFVEDAPMAVTMDALGPIQHRLKNLTLVPSGGESAAAQFVAYVYGEARRLPAEESSIGGYTDRYRVAADELLRADELVKLLRETILGATRRFRPDAPQQQSVIAWRHYHRQLVEIRADLEGSLGRCQDLVRALPLLSEEEQDELAGSPRSRQFISLHQPTKSIAMENALATEYVMSSPPPVAAVHERPDGSPLANRNVYRPPKGIEAEVFQVVTGNSNHRVKDAARMHRAAEDALESARQTVADLEDENHHLRTSNGDLRKQLREATMEVEQAITHMEVDFGRRSEHLVAKEVALVRQECERRIRDVHSKYERTISELQKNHKTSLAEQEEAWRTKVGLNGKDHSSDLLRLEAECKKRVSDIERDCSKKLREERERTQRLIDTQQALCTQTEAKKHEEILSRIKKRHRAVMADLEKKLADETEISQARKKDFENTKLMLTDCERRRGALEAQLTDATRSSKEFEIKSREAAKERQALERDTEYLMTELLSLQQTVSEYRREQRSINNITNNVVSVRRESDQQGDRRRGGGQSMSKSGVSTPREPSRTLFDERSPTYFARFNKSGHDDEGRGGQERGNSPVADSLHCPSSVLNQADDDAFLGSLLGSLPNSPTRRQPSQTWRSTANHRRTSPSKSSGPHQQHHHHSNSGVRRGDASQHSPLGGGHVPNQSAEFQVSPATDDRRHASSYSAPQSGPMSPSVRRVLAAARGALHEVRSSGDELSRTGTGATTPNEEGRGGHHPLSGSRSPQQHSKAPLTSASVRSASSHSSTGSTSHPLAKGGMPVGGGGGGDGGFQSEIEHIDLPALMELEAGMTEELALLEDKESLVKDKRMSVSTTLLAQRNQLLMKNAPEEDIERLNDRISKTMERVNSAMGQIQDRKRRTQHRIGLVRAEMLRKRRYH